jgi:ribosomal protein S18 acetylase RimI-like enzyme
MSRNLITMTYHSQEQIAAILRLEQKCNAFEPIHWSAGIEHLQKKDGDHAILCYQEDTLVGLLSWYTSDGTTANINAVVDPDWRREGIFRSLLLRAKQEIGPLGISTLCYRIPAGSPSGIACVRSLGASFDRSEYAMRFSRPLPVKSRIADLTLKAAQPDDLEFMVTCLVEAFGDSETWTREYLMRTNEPSRKNYIASINQEYVGLIRINHLSETTAAIHDFCILPSHQGKGLGREVLMKTVALLLEDHHSHIRLSVVSNNQRALNLYRAVGFDVVSEFQYYEGEL